MQAITINVSEEIYNDFSRQAKNESRPAAELIRKAMLEYHRQHIVRTTSLRDRRPASAGASVRPVSGDILGEMLS